MIVKLSGSADPRFTRIAQLRSRISPATGLAQTENPRNFAQVRKINWFSM